MAFGFYIDIAILSAVFILVLIFRRSIARLFAKIPLPTFAVYLLSSLPFIVFEEFINCIECFPWTIAWLMSFMIILGITVHFTKAQSLVKIITIFSICGVLFEVFLGRSASGIPELSPLIAFMLFWVALSYAFLAIVPLSILLEKY